MGRKWEGSPSAGHQVAAEGTPAARDDGEALGLTLRHYDQFETGFREITSHKLEGNFRGGSTRAKPRENPDQNPQTEPKIGPRSGGCI